jgi:rhodanese-related sulfurtransferase
MQVFKEIEVADLVSMLEDTSRNISLIDIRNPADAQEKIPGALNIPVHRLPIELVDVAAEQLVVLYCQLGWRSANACAYLSTRGFDNVHNLRGGIQAWKSSGLAVA